MTTPSADPRTVLRALVAAGERFVEVNEVNPTEWPGGSDAWIVDDLNAYEPLAKAVRAAPPALAAIAGKVWLDVETVKALMGGAVQWRDNMVVMDDEPEHVTLTAALAAAAAELRAVEEGR